MHSVLHRATRLPFSITSLTHLYKNTSIPVPLSILERDNDSCSAETINQVSPKPQKILQALPKW